MKTIRRFALALALTLGAAACSTNITGPDITVDGNGITVDGNGITVDGNG